MKRCLPAVLLLAAFVPGCKTAAPKVSPGLRALPASLSEYAGELRVLRHAGDKRNVKVTQGDRPRDGCDVAVQVRSVAFDEGAARFSLVTLGAPRVGQAAGCRQVQPGLQLQLEGLPARGDAAGMRARVDEVLETPEAYLKAKGVDFDLPAGEAPTRVASREVFANAQERTRGRHVTSWPKVLLAVEPWYRDPSGRVQHEGEIELEAIVGTDGRLHRPRLRTGLSTRHEQAVLRVLPLWRFEPARQGDEPVGVRILLRPVLHIY